MENFRDVIRGYDVTYRYNGRNVTTRLPYQPAETVRVGISVLGEPNAVDARDVRTNEEPGGYEGRHRGNRERRYGEERRDGD